MSLALLTLGFLCIRPAQAQSGYPGGGYPGGGYPGGGSGYPGDDPGGTPSPDPGHYWRITYTTQGSTSYAVLDIPYDGISSPESGGYYNGGGPVDEKNINGNISGTITTTLTWIPAAGQTLESDPPSEPVYIKEQSRAEESPSKWGGSGYAPTSSGSADDGLNDPAVPFSLGYSSSGTHLIKKDGSKGLITLDPVTLTAITPVSKWELRSEYPGGYHWDWTGEYCETSFNVSIDADPNPRSVMIVSSIDPTYHKDPATGTQKPNTPASDGTVTADSVNIRPQPAPDTFPRITYSGHPIGSWAADSAYHWYSAGTGNSAAGAFTMPGDPPYDLPLQYLASQTLSQEHVNLHCTDSSDGANATANYYVNWHDELENWVTIVDIRQTGLMTRVTPVYFVTHDDATFSYDLVNKVTVSQKATGEGSLGDDKIGAKFGVELGVDYESEVGNKLELGAYANQYNWLDRQAFWRHREGTVDNYDTHGYVGLLHWTLDSAYNPGNPLIDFVLFQRSSASPPSY